MSKQTAGISYMLEKWGNWKRHFVIGLGYPSSGLEATIIEYKGDLIAGDGNYGGKSGGKQVSFKDDGTSQRVDNMVKRLREKHPKEMEVVTRMYVLRESKRVIGKEMKFSRHSVATHLERGKQLIQVGLQL